MIQEIFKAILITSTVGSFLAVLLLFLKPVTKRIFGFGWQYYSWAIVLIVMMLPITIHIPSEMPNAEKADLPKVQEFFVPQEEWVENENIGEMPLSAVKANTIEASRVNILKSFSFEVMDKVSYLWLVGLILFLTINIVRYWLFLKVIHKNSVIISCPKVGIDKITTLKTTAINAPLMVGLLRPLLLLSDIEMTDENLNYIILHECTHYKRHDLWYKWAAMIVNAVHWFNPFAYIVARQIDEDCEISCDLAVVADMNEDEQKGYMNTILKLIMEKSVTTRGLTTAMASNKEQIKKRFTMIKNAKAKSKVVIIVSAVLACIILGLFIVASGVLNDKTKLLSNDLGDTLENKINMLIIGSGASDIRADTFMVISLDRENNSMKLLSIPRDTMVTVDGKEMKINMISFNHEDQKIVNTVTDNLGIPVSYYARINFEAFRNIVDILGGVEFDVPMDMVYEDPFQNLDINIKKGLQTLDGENAEHLVRYRSGYPMGDITRIEMQQSFIKELTKQKFTAENILKISEVYDELSKNIITDYPAERIVKDIVALSKIDINKIESYTISGEMTRRENVALYKLDEDELKTIVDENFTLG